RGGAARHPPRTRRRSRHRTSSGRRTGAWRHPEIASAARSRKGHCRPRRPRRRVTLFVSPSHRAALTAATPKCPPPPRILGCDARISPAPQPAHQPTTEQYSAAHTGRTSSQKTLGRIPAGVVSHSHDRLAFYIWPPIAKRAPSSSPLSLQRPRQPTPGSHTQTPPRAADLAPAARGGPV